MWTLGVQAGVSRNVVASIFGHVRQSGELMVGQTEGLLGPVNFKEQGAPYF